MVNVSADVPVNAERTTVILLQPPFPELCQDVLGVGGHLVIFSQFDNTSKKPPCKVKAGTYEWLTLPQLSERRYLPGSNQIWVLQSQQSQLSRVQVSVEVLKTAKCRIQLLETLMEC